MPTRTGYTFDRWVETGKNKAKKNNLTITADSSSGTTLGYVSMPTISFAKQLTIAVSFDYKITARDSNISSISLKASATLSNISIDNSEYPSLGNDWTKYSKVLTVKTSSWALWTNMSGLYIACPNVAGTLTMEVRNVQIETNDSVTDYEPYEYTSTTQYTKLGDQTLKAIWTANSYSLTLYENKNILKGSALSSESDLSYWKDLFSSNYASQQIVTIDGKQCVKITFSGAMNGELFGQKITSSVKANTEYIISAEFKLDSNVGEVYFHFPGDTSASSWGDIMEEYIVYLNQYANQGWQEFSTTRTTKNVTINSAYFLLYCHEYFTGPIYMRNVSMAEKALKSVVSATYGSAKTVSALTYDGHTFLGYYTQPVGGVKVFGADGSAVKGVSGWTDANGNWIKTESGSLYGQWA